MQTTEGTLLGGRVRYRQPRDGFRTGLEPVLLAASVPARAGQVVLEGGVGAGAGLMCLTAREPGVTGVGVEVDADMAALARDNLAANGMTGLAIVIGDVTGMELPPADHAMANPPWHDPASTASPLDRRRRAKQEEAGGVERWVAALGRALGDRGSLTMIVPTSLAMRVTAAFGRAGLGAVARLDLLAKADRPAKLTLLQAWSGRDGAGSVASLPLHEADGAFTPRIDDVLRRGAALAFA